MHCEQTPTEQLDCIDGFCCGGIPDNLTVVTVLCRRNILNGSLLLQPVTSRERKLRPKFWGNVGRDGCTRLSWMVLKQYL